MKVILIMLLVFSGIYSYAFDKSTSVDQAVTLIESAMTQKNYKMDLSEDNVDILYLKEWPEEVQTGLLDAIEFDDYLTTDDEALGVTFNYTSGDGEYVVDAVIIRSLRVNLDTDTLYVAAYRVFGGEWGRPTEYRLYYILDSKGNLLKKNRL